MADAASHTANNPSKFISHFLYKAAIVTAFLVLFPFFPSLAPEFINQTLHARSWELFQLIFVGIAVSYGLFSKKNDDETEKLDHGSKLDNAQSYVSKLLQVSSVFDDESENQTVIEENKIQTSNSQYYRGEPLVVVAKESPVVSSEIRQKPLLLPVRSLKQRVQEADEVDLVGDESGGRIGLVHRSNLSSSSKRFTGNSRKSTIKDVGGLSVEKLEEKLEENIVLRSPIPWRSRSGRMEMRENGDGIPSFPVSDAMEERELNRLDTKSFKLFSPNSSSKNLSSPSSISPPHKLSPSTSFSSESQAKSSEDVMRKKNSPPPAPPPPPFLRKTVMMKSNSGFMNNGVSPEKIFRRSVRSVPAEELSGSEVEGPTRRMNSGRMQNDGGGLAKSVRTFRSTSEDYEPNLVEQKGYVVDKMMNGKASDEERQTYVKFHKEGRNELVEKVVMETSDDDEDSDVETEDDQFPGSSSNVGEASTDSSGNDVGPDVDKKADEFIAKFREQIRLQRIESIRRSTAQRAGKTFR